MKHHCTQKCALPFSSCTITTGFISVGTIVENSRGLMTLGQSPYSQILRGQIKEKPKRQRRPIGLKKRFEILKRDGFKCVYCGNKAGERPLHVDHIMPVSKGGGNTDDNLAAACFECNMGKKADIHEGLTEHVFGTKKKEPYKDGNRAISAERISEIREARQKGQGLDTITFTDADTGMSFSSNGVTNMRFGARVVRKAD